MRLRQVVIGTVLSLAAAFSLAGCRLVFEPEVDAISRMMASMPTGDNRVVRELCDGEEVCKQLARLSGLIRSEWYGRVKGFYEIEEVEIADDTGYSYVHINLRIPASGHDQETRLPLVFEMERIKFRWHIYSVDGIEEFLRRAERARGIL